MMYNHQNSFYSSIDKIPSPTLSDDSGIVPSPESCVDTDDLRAVTSYHDPLLGDPLCPVMTTSNNFPDNEDFFVDSSTCQFNPQFDKNLVLNSLVRCSNNNPNGCFNFSDRCLLPKKGNAKPRQTSNKRLKGLHGVRKSVNPRAKTVREQLEAIRKTIKTDYESKVMELELDLDSMPVSTNLNSIYPSPNQSPSQPHYQPVKAGPNPPPGSIQTNMVQFSNNYNKQDHFNGYGHQCVNNTYQQENNFDDFVVDNVDSNLESIDVGNLLFHKEKFEMPDENFNLVPTEPQKVEVVTQANTIYSNNRCDGKPPPYHSVYKPTGNQFQPALTKTYYLSQGFLDLRENVISCDNKRLVSLLNQLSVEQTQQALHQFTSDGMNLLMTAIKSGNLHAVKLFLQFDTSIVHHLKSDGCNIFHVAAIYFNSDIMNFLIQCSKNNLLLKKLLNQPASNHSGHTPLHLACITANNKLVKLLLDAGANILAQDKQGFSPLHLAITSSSASLVCFILQFAEQLSSNPHLNGCKVLQQVLEQKNHNKDTALHLASNLMNNQMKEVDESTQLRILELLLNKGAYPSATNKQNLTPFDLLPSNSKAFQLFTAYNQQPYEQQFLGCKTQQFHNTQLPNVNEFFQTPSASNDVVLTTSIYQN